jgi:hypothetical protein
MTENELEVAQAELPAKPRKPRAPKLSDAGSDLLPDLEQHRDAVETSFCYWVGVTPACPVNQIDVAGVAFPKVNEIVELAGNETVRIPVIGGLVWLTRPEIEEMRKRIKRTVIRFVQKTTEPGEVKPKYLAKESGVGMSASEALVSDREGKNRKGFAITIPTAEELEERRKNNFSAIPYQQQRGDEPAACYMFAQPCADQNAPSRGSVYPQTLDKTGLVWPGD